MRHTAKDLDRAMAFLSEHLDSSYDPDYSAHEMADLIATVRRETIEECARTIRRNVSNTHAAEQCIRALLDEPKAEEPDAAGLLHDRIGPASGKLIASKPVKAEPKCKACGGPVDAHGWTDCPHFEPEEPGHG